MSNPILDSRFLEGEFPPFNLIETKHFLPAVKELISRTRSAAVELKKIPKPTFENFILPFEDSLRKNSQVQEIYGMFGLSKSSDEFKKIEPEIAAMISDFNTELFSDVDLFRKVNEVYQVRSRLEQDQQRLVENYYKWFIRTGCNLDPAKKKRFKEISQELAKLTVEFGQNIQRSTMEFKLDVKESQLKGLSSEVISKLESNARAEKRDGYLATLEPALYIEVMEKSEDSELRKKFYFGWNRRAYKDKYDNSNNVFKIAQLRNELAQILGYTTYAAYVLEERMAKTVETVDDFVDRLTKAYRPFAEKEEKELRDFIKAKTGSEKHDIWDRSYWSRKLLEEKYAFDEEVFKEYLVYGKVLNALFQMAEKLYGIRFVKSTRLPLYEADTEAFEVFDQKNNLLAYLLVDPFTRLETKKHGAWMMQITPSYHKKGERVPPAISVNTNFTKPEDGRPLLLTIDEAVTLFHEFGHALHGMLTKARYASIGGTNVLWDFVELPSQFMENFFYEKEILNLFAFHHKTGKPIPQNYVEGLVRFRRFRTASQAMRQIAFILLDMGWHSGKLLSEAGSLNAIEKKLLDPVLVFKEVGDVSNSASFSHIFSGGYSSGYYSYKWAEVLDADAFIIFKSEGLLNPKTATRFLHSVLEVGDSVEPMKAYVNFAGRPPRVEAMLERDGFPQP